MKPFHYLIALSFAGISLSVNAQAVYSRVVLKIPPEGLGWLETQGVEFDHGEVNKEEKTFITTIDEVSLANLKKAGIAYSVLIDDEAARFAKTARKEDFYKQRDAVMLNGQLQFENPCGSHYDRIAVPAGFISGSYGGYYTWQEMQQRIDSLVHHYPHLVQKIILPTPTLEGRPLIVVKISDNPGIDEAEPEAFYTGLHHAREGMSMMNLFFFMQYLVENYATDNRVRDLVDNRELFFLPCVNPDGYYYNQVSQPGGGGMWRKNRRPNGGSQYGVDLNRNYNVDWGVTGTNISTSHSPVNDAYVGPSAFSELETQAIRAFSATRHFKVAIDHHAYGNYYVTPYGRPALHPLTVADQSFYSYASALMSRYNGYFTGDGMATVGYYAVGNSRDWHISGDIGMGTKEKTYGYTVEVGSGNTGFGFWPDPEYIIPIAKSMFFANMQMAYMAGAYYELQDMQPVAITSSTGYFDFSLRRIGLTDGPVSVSIVPLENIASITNSVTEASLGNYFDTVQRRIGYTLPPLLPAGSTIRFVYEISAGGITLRDTITKLLQPVSLLSDNMEWNANASWTLSGSWGTSSSTAYQGTRALNESPGGNYGNNTTSTATYNHAFDLSDATSAYLSFWVKHRAENSFDKLQVQVSTGGSYQSLCGQQTVSEDVGTLGSQPALTGMRDAWTREVINLRNYLGNASVNFRFRFTSNGSGVLDGFYIDNVELVKATSLVLSSGTGTAQPPPVDQSVSGIRLYPNPVQQAVFVRFNNAVRSVVLVRITDLAGRQYVAQQVELPKGTVNHRIEVSQLPPQVYLIHTGNAQTGETAIFKVIKQ
ncbi:M14 family zinc carboxypeptidase [Paraflavitalea pollutisoli]|uniref:M14 family zinc carboxypeptidase n=1 Tax=Paraflavitalea pollutisoli TaxID=3034143 RepID=UPI0023EBEC98|nr:M14 family zinc carboxypeptidase [Paraflavitalea sp. H1-2-19X]